MFLLILEKLFGVSVTAGSKTSVARGLAWLQRADPAEIVHWLRCSRQQMRGKAEAIVRDQLSTQAQGSQATSLGFVKIN